MKKIAILSLIAASLLVACASGQRQDTGDDAGVVLKDTYIYGKPGGSVGESKVRVNRGEGVSLLKSEEGQNGWAQVLLADRETKGWIVEKYLHRGPKIEIRLTQNASLYVRPDANSKIESTIVSGTYVLVLKQLDDWKKVSVEYEKEGWINSGAYTSGSR